ncbi:MAG: sigma-54 dependent transcriptional regulator [Myxococcota bacterium]
MELPGLALLAQHAPDAARRLEEFVRRLIASVDADRWASEQVRTLVEAQARGDVLGALVALVQAEADTGEAWAVLFTGDPTHGVVSFRAVAGSGRSPPEPESFSRTLLAAVARRSRGVWLDEGADSARMAAAASIVANEVQPHGAVPLGGHGAVYLAGTTDLRPISARSKQRIESLCRIAGGFVDAIPDRAPPQAMLHGMVGRSRPMQDLARTLRGFAAVPWPVLILGETGTGKELVARALHDLSARADGPFVALNCAAIPDELAESTLFGHERGAFTGADRRREGLLERADRGTLFLDEVGELSPRVQAKLLRVLQEGRYERVGGDRELRFDGRILAATLRALAPDESGFRADLYHRLGACVVRVPPLRDRPEDIRPLASFLLSRALQELPSAGAIGLSEAALADLERRPWPGNVRELDNVLKAALADAVGRGARTIGVEQLAPAHERSAPAAQHRAVAHVAPPAPSDRFALSGNGESELLPIELLSAVEQVQRAFVRDALRRTNGHRPTAASRLGVSRQWLHTLLTRWNDSAPERGADSYAPAPQDRG